MSSPFLFLLLTYLTIKWLMNNDFSKNVWARKVHRICDLIRWQYFIKRGNQLCTRLPTICCWVETAGRGGNDTADAIKLQICGNIGIGSVGSIGSATGASERQGRDLYTYFIGLPPHRSSCMELQFLGKKKYKLFLPPHRWSSPKS